MPLAVNAPTLEQSPALEVVEELEAAEPTSVPWLDVEFLPVERPTGPFLCSN